MSTTKMTLVVVDAGEMTRRGLVVFFDLSLVDPDLSVRVSSAVGLVQSFVQEEDVVTVVAAVGVALSLGEVIRIVAGRYFAAGPTGVVAVSTSPLPFG